MARYIDADKFIKQFERALEHQQKYGLYNHAKITEYVIKAIENEPTADVVPKSEVVKVLDEIEKTIHGVLVLVGFSYKHNPKEIQCKKECYEDFLGYIAELKKKYTEELNKCQES